ncbi:hypothetical protein [Streptomyces sp. NPDC089795]|uniref:hypothetical protein n=1 Tax=Streptomyces sp. NPDC089795 TaxID=3155297 RepID=UPI00344164B5
MKTAPTVPERGARCARRRRLRRTDDEQARTARSGAHLTTTQSTRLHDTDHSLKAGPRGPVLLRDHHLREVPCRRL